MVAKNGINGVSLDFPESLRNRVKTPTRVVPNNRKTRLKIPGWRVLVLENVYYTGRRSAETKQLKLYN